MDNFLKFWTSGWLSYRVSDYDIAFKISAYQIITWWIGFQIFTLDLDTSSLSLYLWYPSVLKSFKIPYAVAEIAPLVSSLFEGNLKQQQK